MATDYQIAMRFRRIDNWCTSNGFMAGWPNFHEATYTNPRRKVYGHFLLKDAVLDWRDVPASVLAGLTGGVTSARARFTGAHDYAVSQGYQHGFPNFQEANYGAGVVYGIYLVVPGTCEWRDVPASELGLGYGNPTNHSMDKWFAGASDYAVRNGFAAGMPNGHLANDGSGYVCGVFLFPLGTAEWQDIRGNQLGLYDEPAPPPPSGQNNPPKTSPPPPPPPPPQLADLSFVNTWIEPTAFPAAGAQFTVIFSFGNFGTVTSKQCTGRFQLDSGQTWDITLPELSPGQGNTMFLSFPNGLTSGDHYLYAYLDINSEVNELRKDNNITYNGFRVG